MGGVFSKLGRRFKNCGSKTDARTGEDTKEGSAQGHGGGAPAGTGADHNGGAGDPRGSREYARLVDSTKAVEEEFHAAMRRTHDPVILAALAQSLLIVRSQVEPLLEIHASDEDRAVASDVYDMATQSIHDARTPVDEREDGIRSARYKTTMDGRLHETKSVKDYDELLFALEDLSRKISPGDGAEVYAAGVDEDGKTVVEELSIDWGDAGDGKISLVFGPTSLLPVPDAMCNGSTGSSGGAELALTQPDELGRGVEESDLHGVDVEHVIEVVEAIRHDDVKAMARAKRDDPESYRIASIADGYMVSWYDDEGDRPSMKEAVLKAISDNAAGRSGPSREFLEAMQAKLGDGGLR